MSAIRLPLLCAFAGGCLSSAVLFGFWRADAGAGETVAKQQRQPRVELVAPAVSAALAAPSAEPSRDLAAAAAEQARNGAGEATPPATQAVDSAGPEPAGSAVSDVLMDLEAAYRAHVAATAPARQERAVAAAPPDDAVALASQPVAAVVTVPPAPTVPPPPTVAPVAVAVAAVEPPSAPPPIAAPPAYLAQADSRPTEVHIGDVNQNTYITNVRQGDVYLIQMQQQMQQMQQLAMLQYMQLFGMSSGIAAPAQRGRGAARQPAAFPSTITNPDNPWGFHFSPPNLVH